MSSELIKHIRRQEAWCDICNEKGHYITSCDFFSDEERLLFSVMIRMVRKKNKKFKDAGRDGGRDERAARHLPVGAQERPV